MPPRGSGPLDQKGQLLMPTMVHRRTESPGVLMRVVPRFIGYVRVYDRVKGFGFIKPQEAPEGDVYFKRSELPQEVRSYPRAKIIGMQVEFAGHLASWGQARAEGLKSVDEFTGAGDGAGAGAVGGGAANVERRSRGAPPLGPEVVSEMSQFLKIHGGVMDYGKFSTAFAGVKKPQLGGHFLLAPESGDVGGRWRIALPGAEPLLRGSGGGSTNGCRSSCTNRGKGCCGVNGATGRCGGNCVHRSGRGRVSGC